MWPPGTHQACCAPASPAHMRLPPACTRSSPHGLQLRARRLRLSLRQCRCLACSGLCALALMGFLLQPLQPCMRGCLLSRQSSGRRLKLLRLLLGGGPPLQGRGSLLLRCRCRCLCFGLAPLRRLDISQQVSVPLLQVCQPLRGAARGGAAARTGRSSRCHLCRGRRRRQRQRRAHREAQAQPCQARGCGVGRRCRKQQAGGGGGKVLHGGVACRRRWQWRAAQSTK